MPDGESGGRGRMRNWPQALLLVIVVASLVFAYSQWASRRRLEVAVGNQYFRSFFDLLGNVDNVRVALSKSLASGSPKLRVGALSDVWREASAAQANLNNLPVTHAVLARTSAFLTQVGDFAFTTARKVAGQQVMSEDDWSKLVDLKKQSEDLARGLAEMEAQASSGKISWVKVAEQAKSEVKPRPGSSTTPDVVKDGFTKVDEQVQTFPTLIYDGPFSDHIEEIKPRGITGAEISADQAKEVALKFVPFDASSHSVTVEEDIKAKGDIDIYRIRLDAPKRSEKPDAVVDVTKKGGHVVLMNVARDIGDKTIDLAESIKRAGAFLREVGITNMTPTFASEVGDVSIVPFVYMQDGVLIYPDQLKVKVALDDGAILSYDALAYLTSHTVRKLPKPAIEADEARELLSPALTVTDSARLAVIPVETVDTPEAYCWEFRGTSYGERFFVYVNAETGTEEKILQLITTSEGSLTM
ncbi:MAG: germination protein YpeB [Firmicutes bacterium]|nr:germination protein YpeB [Bacillota bacterium]MDD4791709.1 germination protein YpeB [Bacillota bacterium]